VNQWLRRLPGLRFTNSYGPTEVTVGCIGFAKPELGPLHGEGCPIGTPHNGSRALLVDANGEIVHDPQVVGELLLGGAQLMRGYWNAPELTRRAFIERDGVRYYRSGDMAHRDAQGLYWFDGRRDEQVKFLGHRVHLSELQSALTQHPAVCGATAGAMRDAHGREQLGVIGLVPFPPTLAFARTLRAFMRQHLPSYMLPGVIGLVGAWPRLPSGKADMQRCLAELAQAAARFGCGAYVRTDDDFVPLREAEQRTAAAATS
jgi:acyl-coenzyme A synthetase/AMP-(fatty) acid ligase